LSLQKQSEREPIKSRVVCLGDFIDTDAVGFHSLYWTHRASTDRSQLAPSEFLLTALTDEALGGKQ